MAIPTRSPDAPSAAAEAPDAVTVREVHRLLLPGSRLVGGAAGLDRRVLWATSLRLRPPAFEPQGGGEFVLASRVALESLQQAEVGFSLARVVQGLADAGAVALAAVAEPPPGAAAAADALALPLFGLPEDHPLLATERGIISLVVDRQNTLQARASQFYRQLAQLALEDRGLDAIIREAAAACGRLVAFEDAQFRLRTAAAPPGGDVPPLDAGGLSSVEERGHLSELVRTQPVSGTTPAAVLLSAARWQMARYVAPVVTREHARGFVSICADLPVLTEFDQQAVSRAAAICALELAKEDKVLAAEQRIQGEVADELLRPSADPEAAVRRAAQAGLSADGTFAVYAFGVTDSAAGDYGTALTGLAATLDRRLRAMRCPSLGRVGTSELLVICELPPHDGGAGRAEGRATRHQPNGQARSRAGPHGGPTATGRVPVTPDGAHGGLVQLGNDLFGAAADEIGAPHLCAGASRPHAGLAGLPQAALEAREALRVGRRVYGAGRLVAFADLGLYRVLHALRDSPELRSFYEQTLGPLVAYDRRTGQNWIETLEVFFACHGNLSETAKRLRLHRNALLYRIARIQEIGGVALEDPETRLSLQVALKARRLLA